MKKYTPLFFFLFFANILLCQTSSIRGVLLDDTTTEPLIGATVISGEVGTVTEYDGSYVLELENGTHEISFSYVGYNTVTRTVEVNGNMQLDISLGTTILNEVVVTADIAIERKTPVAFSNIPSIQIQEELAGQEVVMALNSTPGAYATQSGGGDGDARISIRGFNQRNIAVMLDGIPVNDMENGWVFWSNWFGLDLVTQTMQVQRGLGASKLSLPSVGGTVNILTKGIDAKKGFRFRQEVGNDGYFRSTFGLTTGRMENGWGISAAGSYKQGDGWVDGNFTKGYFYYLRIDKNFGKHTLSLQGFGAPQEHGQRSFTTEIARTDSEYAQELGVPSEVIDGILVAKVNRGRRYNEFWGLKDGEVFNTRKNFYHKPQISLRHSVQATDKLFWTNIAYLSIGSGGGTAVENSPPRTDDWQYDLDQVYETNELLNGLGVGSQYYLRANHNDHFWYGLLSKFQYTMSDNWTLSGGLDGRYYEGDHYRTVYDALGGSFINQGLDEVNEGEKIEYDYTGFVRWLGTFATLEYSKDKWSAFLSLSAAHNGFRAENYFRVQQELDWINLTSSQVKIGAKYNLNENNSVFVNTGLLSKNQRFSNVIRVNRFASGEGTDKHLSIFQDFDNEQIQALEVGYNYKSPRFSANVNTYFTNWQNKPLDSPPTVAIPDASGEITPESERIPVNIPGIDAIHAGIEIDFALKVHEKVMLEGLASIADWRWNSAETATIILPNFTDSYEFDAEGVKVGDAAQLQFGGLLRIEPIKGLYFKLRGTYFGNNYANFQPEDLQPNEDPALSTAGRQSWLMPDYTLFNAHGGYNFTVGKSRVGVRFNVLNLFDAVYISDARNNDRFNSIPSTDFDAKSASVHFGQGRRWTASVQVSF